MTVVTLRRAEMGIRYRPVGTSTAAAETGKISSSSSDGLSPLGSVGLCLFKLGYSSKHSSHRKLAQTRDLAASDSDLVHPRSLEAPIYNTTVCDKRNLNIKEV